MIGPPLRCFRAPLSVEGRGALFEGYMVRPNPGDPASAFLFYILRQLREQREACEAIDMAGYRVADAALAHLWMVVDEAERQTDLSDHPIVE